MYEGTDDWEDERKMRQIRESVRNLEMEAGIYRDEGNKIRVYL